MNIGNYNPKFGVWEIGVWERDNKTADGWRAIGCFMY
jgi:hypothetical protein